MSQPRRRVHGFRVQLEGTGSVREWIQAVVEEAESATRLIHASLLLVHQSLLVSEVMEKAKVQIEAMKGHFGRIAEIPKECPQQYYRYHGDWKSKTHTIVSLIAFLHWLETGDLLMHTDTERELGRV